MLETTRGIVLHSQKYSEGSLIVNIFTESHGNLGFIVKIPKSRTSSLRTVFLRPLSILEIVFDYRPNLSLQRITEIRLAVSYQTLPFDPLKETMALFLSEFLYYALRNEQPSISLFSYLTNGLEWLDMREGLEKLDIYKKTKISYIYTFFKVLLQENNFPLYFHIILQSIFYFQLLCIISAKNDYNSYSQDYLIYMII